MQIYPGTVRVMRFKVGANPHKILQCAFECKSVFITLGVTTPITTMTQVPDIISRGWQVMRACAMLATQLSVDSLTIPSLPTCPERPLLLPSERYQQPTSSFAYGTSKWIETHPPHPD
jgi:hypothetical protein